MKKPTVGQLKLRLPSPLRRQLDQAADKSGRSLNSEIVWRLEHSFTYEANTADFAKRFTDLERQFSQVLDQLGVKR